jgi:hypothetical protein
MTYEKILVQPAIIHATRSKNALKDLGEKFLKN